MENRIHEFSSIGRGTLGTSSLNAKPGQRGGTIKSIVALVNQKGNRPE
ncbi:hypothetical protein SaSA97_0553 [Streptococcus agalactiae]|nr:hypothetical protein SaSA97_0553 [Streptococcus agalactiae]